MPAMPTLDLFRLDGRAALITGAGRGIGLSIARALVEVGAAVAIQDIDRDVAEGEAAKIRGAGGRAVAVGGDATSLADVERWPAEAAGALGIAGVDVLVNNASVQGHHPIEEWSVDEAERILRANVTGLWRLCQLVLPHMRGQRWGRILNLGSIQGFRGSPQMGPYSVSKGAVHHMTATLAKGLAEHGITVNAIAPGIVDTLRNEHFFGGEHAKEAGKWVPLGRTSVPDDCAAAALLLCSDAGAYITGAVLPVDGGMHVR